MNTEVKEALCDDSESPQYQREQKETLAEGQRKNRKDVSARNKNRSRGSNKSCTLRDCPKKKQAVEWTRCNMRRSEILRARKWFLGGLKNIVRQNEQAVEQINTSKRGRQNVHVHVWARGRVFLLRVFFFVYLVPPKRNEELKNPQTVGEYLPLIQPTENSIT